MANNLLLAMLFTAILTTGCAPFAPNGTPKPAVEIDVPFSITTQGASTDMLWWKNFESEELNQLIETALTDNFTVATAYARVKQASASLEQAGAAQYPQLTLDGSAQGTRRSSQADSSSQKTISNTEKYRAGAAASYELDLWGKIEATRSASEQTYFATQADLDAAAVTVAASVASTWVDLLAVREEIDILTVQIENNVKRLDFQELRFENGLAASVDVFQQRQILAASQSELPLLVAKEQVLRNALSVLIGSTPLSPPQVSQEKLPELIPLPKTGLPSDLLMNRPDIRAAGHELFSSQWSVAQARADRLPQFTLSASAAFESAAAGVFFQNWAGALAGNIVQPLLDGGKRAAEVERTRAVVEERATAYASTVATAIQEVEDALVNEKQQQEYIKLTEAQYQATYKTLEAAQLQYLQGQSGYLPLLQEVLDVQSLERTILQEKAELLKYRITLYRTLGGGWTHNLARVAPEETPESSFNPEARIEGT